MTEMTPTGPSSDFETAFDHVLEGRQQAIADAHQAAKERDAAYRERAHLVALLAATYPSRWGYDPNATQWRIVYVDLPTGQASWHISPDDVGLFPHVTEDGGDAEWDGHTTAAKYARIDQLTQQLASDAETGTAVHDLLAELGQRARDTKAGNQ